MLNNEFFTVYEREVLYYRSLDASTWRNCSISTTVQGVPYDWSSCPKTRSMAERYRTITHALADLIHVLSKHSFVNRHLSSTAQS